MLRKSALLFLITFVLCGGLAMAQYDRDEVVNITYPVSGTVINTDTLEVTFDLASFFVIGDSACTDCDGYLNAYLNDELATSVHEPDSFIIRDLTDGYYLMLVEAVDPDGASFMPMVWDTVSFSVMYEENFCPPGNFSVSSTYQYDALALTWREPFLGAEGMYFEDFDAGDGGYTGTADWEWSDSYDPNDYTGIYPVPDAAYSGDGLWGTVLAGDYPNSSNSTLDSPPISLSGYAEPQLSFWHWYYIEYSWDGGNVKLSTDGGTTWTILQPDSGYDDDAASTANAGIPGEPCFTGYDQGFWELETFDLSAYTGEQIIIRWHFGSDGSVQRPGWFIDDVTVGEPAPDVFSREFIMSCGDLTGYEVYRDDTWLADVDTNFYVDGAVTLGTEYCYYITAVYDSAGSEVVSDTSNNACGIPETFIPMPPTYLSAIPGDEEVYLDWAEPGLTFQDGENCLVPIVIGDVGDGFNQVIIGDNTGFINDYTNGATANGPDVVYQFTVLETVNISFSLCNAATWDTYLILLNGGCDEILAFDDDGCGTLQSLLEGTLGPGVYNIVVDGYGSTSYGVYSMTMTATATRALPGFIVSVEDHNKISDHELEVQKAAIDGSQSTRDISGSFVVATAGYLPGSASFAEFTLTVVSTDASECDSFAVTFPAELTVLDAGPFLLEGMYSEEFNGVQGQTISWGSDRDDGNGGISGTINFWAMIVADPGASGPLTCDYFFSDDGDATIVDAVGTFDIEERILSDGEFLGYNVYIDASADPDNDYELPYPGYMVEELTNAVTYDFQVTALYHPDYESAPLSVSATPTWLFGDITGVITDPNSATLDSAVVSAGGISDTTGTNGVYLLHNLVPGTYTVSVKRPGFDGSKDDVTVMAQEAASVQDFMMIPKLGKPGGLVATSGDMLVDLAWNSPGSVVPGEWVFFHDGTFENAISSTDGGMGLAQLFVPPAYPATIQAVRFHVSDFGSFAQDIEVNVYADDGITVLSGPYILPGVSDDWIEIDIDDATIDDGAFLVATYNVLAGGPYVSIDEDSYSASLFFGNEVDGWTEMGDYGFFAEGSHEALIAAAGRSVTVFSNGIVLNNQTTDIPVSLVNVAGSHGPTTPRLHDALRTVSTREDSLLGYHVYQETATGDTLVAANASDDTTATITVPANYVEYCFTVKAVWDTDVYDTLESKPSNMVCIVPYLPGDVDFIDGVTVFDLLIVVDFALGVSTPSPDQFRGADINRDGVINIQDIIMIVDIILPPTAARVSNADDGTSAVLGLAYDGQHNLRTLLTYDGIVRGAQFSIKYDANAIELGTPGISGAQKDLIINYRESQPGIMNVVIANVVGGSLNITDETLLIIPLTVKETSRIPAQITLEQSILVGSQGQSIPVIEKSISLDILSVPTRYALHQNYPNPFNPVTDILFDLPKAGPVELVIYNLMGQVVRTLVNSELTGGYHKIRWNGLSDKGAPIATGMYFYQISAGSYHATKKMVLLK